MVKENWPLEISTNKKRSTCPAPNELKIEKQLQLKIEKLEKQQGFYLETGHTRTKRNTTKKNLKKTKDSWPTYGVLQNNVSMYHCLEMDAVIIENIYTIAITTTCIIMFKDHQECLIV